MSNYSPTHDRVLVKRSTAVAGETVTKSGIHLPGAVEKLNRGTVVAIGPGRVTETRVIKSSVDIGDVVVFAKHSGFSIDSSDETLVLLNDSDVLCKVLK